MVTSSPTTGMASIRLFQSTPNSLRLILVVALAPVDRAEALYQLALAHHEAGNASAARSEVLRALEEAPNFEKAQSLLLTLRSGASQTPVRPPE